MNAEEIKLLQAQNEALKKQCNNLQQEVKQWKHEYEMLDACIELEQGKIAELKAENDRLNKILQEIKTIAERCNLCEECSGLDDCERECSDAVEPCSTYQMKIIVSKITKAEEE